MSIVFGILLFVAWVISIEMCIESSRSRNVALLTLLICSYWLMFASVKKLDCGGVTHKDRPDLGIFLPWQ